jgi:hypothetical protein
MTLPRHLTAVPRAWPVRMEIMKAAHTLARQIAEEDEHRPRRSEAAAGNLVDEFVAAMRELRQELRKELRKAGFNPNEPRVPAGNPDGGQWTDNAAVALNDPETLSDAPDPTAMPWARSAQGRSRRGGYDEGTPAQEARLEIARARWQETASVVQRIDPTWQPRQSLIANPPTPEGEIAKYESETKEAEDRIAEVTGVGATPPPRGTGHHYVPQTLYLRELLREDTRQVFKDASSGPLADSRVNLFTGPHRDYNDAVAEAFESFLQERGITSEEMTPRQARDFLYEIFRSTEPRIRGFNMRIFQERELRRQHDRLLGRGNEDDE